MRCLRDSGRSGCGSAARSSGQPRRPPGWTSRGGCTSECCSSTQRACRWTQCAPSHPTLVPAPQYAPYTSPLNRACGASLLDSDPWSFPSAYPHGPPHMPSPALSARPWPRVQIEDVCETDPLSLHLDEMFSPAAPPLSWDQEGAYTRQNIRLIAEVRMCDDFIWVEFEQSFEDTLTDCVTTLGVVLSCCLGRMTEQLALLRR